MDKIAIHRYERGRHPAGGKWTHYEVVSGPNPLGPRGGLGGKWVDGTARKHFWNSSDALEYAQRLAVDEGLEFVSGGVVATNREGAPIEKPRDPPLPREAFDPNGAVDTRQRQLAKTTMRPGQQEFRRSIINAYANRCALSGCIVSEALEAAHIHPYLGDASDHVTNGLLLRADLHKIFDRFLIAIDSTLALQVSKVIRHSEYGLLHGRTLSVPKELLHHPSNAALAFHYASFLDLEHSR